MERGYFIFIPIVIVCIITIYAFLFPNLTLDYKTYKFRINDYSLTKDNHYIRNFIFRYDFDRDIGRISFRFKGAGDKIDFDISIPKQLKIINYSISENLDLQNKKNVKKLINCDYNKNDNHLNCNSNESFNNLLEFDIKIKGNETNKFYPNGLFLIGSNLKNFTAYSNGTEKQNILIRFDLGSNKYRCKNPCFINDLRNQDLNYYLENNDLVIYTLPGTINENVDFSRIRLNTYNHHEKLWRNMLLTLSISLLAATLILLLEKLIIINREDKIIFINKRKRIYLKKIKKLIKNLKKGYLKI